MGFFPQCSLYLRFASATDDSLRLAITLLWHLYPLLETLEVSAGTAREQVANSPDCFDKDFGAARADSLP